MRSIKPKIDEHEKCFDIHFFTTIPSILQGKKERADGYN